MRMLYAAAFAAAFVLSGHLSVATAQQSAPTSLVERSVQSSAPATYMFGQDYLAPDASTPPAEPYQPVNPATMPRVWDPRSDKTRELMAELNRTLCPMALTPVECWQESQPHPINPERRQGWLEVMAIFYETNGTIINRMTQNKLPAEYGRELFEASKDPASGVFRADCSAGWIEFLNIRRGMPLGPYPIIGWNNQLRTAEFIDTVSRTGSRPGYGTPQLMVDIHRGQVRVALPETIFTDWAEDPIGRVDAFQDSQALQSQRLPKGAPGLYTIPYNPKRGHENDFLRANRETGQLRLAVIVEEGKCPRFDYAHYLRKLPPRS